MIKQNKTKLQFVLGAILFLSVAFAACDGEKKETVKDEAVTTTIVRDSLDTMEKIKGEVSPVEEVKPK